MSLGRRRSFTSATNRRASKDKGRLSAAFILSNDLGPRIVEGYKFGIVAEFVFGVMPSRLPSVVEKFCANETTQL
jgi:hypothetical protein